MVYLLGQRGRMWDLEPPEETHRGIWGNMFPKRGAGGLETQDGNFLHAMSAFLGSHGKDHLCTRGSSGGVFVCRAEESGQK